jgi:hypothetical protein
MASQKPVADTLADKFAKAQQRGKKDASKGSATRRTRSKGALEDSSSEEEVFQSPTGAAAAPAEPAAPFRQGGLVLRSPVLTSTYSGATIAGSSPTRRRRSAPKGESSEQRGRGRRTAAAAAAPPARIVAQLPAEPYPRPTAQFVAFGPNIEEAKEQSVKQGIEYFFCAQNS